MKGSMEAAVEGVANLKGSDCTAAVVVLFVVASSKDLAVLRSSSESDDASVVLPLLSAVMGNVPKGCIICAKLVVVLPL